MHDCHRSSKMVQQLVFIILSKLKLMVGILGSQSPKFHSREICTDFHISLLLTSGTCLFLSKGMRLKFQKKHSNVLVLVFGSHSRYAVDRVPVLPFLRNGAIYTFTKTQHWYLIYRPLALVCGCGHTISWENLITNVFIVNFVSP